MPEVMDWPQADSRAGIARAVQHLREGRLVVLPTESVYMVVANALAPEALLALDAAIVSATPLTLLLGQTLEVFDWLPFSRGAGIRLARRFWPGPLTLVSGTGIRQGLFTRLPKPVQQRLVSPPLKLERLLSPPLTKGGPGGGLPNERLALRCPDHAAARQTALQLGMPLLAAATPCITPDQVTEAFGAQVASIILDGQTALAQPDTVVETQGREWRMVSVGAIPANEIEEAALCRIMFVCTGNTCRSPLAEALCKKLLADKMGCTPAELRKHGFCVQSAGLAAMMGSEAAPEAVAAAQELSVDLSGHRSQPLTAEMLVQADRLYAMTGAHLRMLDGIRGVTPRLLSRAGADVADPIGAPAEVYRDCARQLYCYLEEMLPELLEC